MAHPCNETWSMQKHKGGGGGKAGSPRIWRGKFGGQIETPNFPAPNSRPTKSPPHLYAALVGTARFLLRGNPPRD